MPKRKKAYIEEPPKKQKVDPQLDRTSPISIPTKQPKQSQKENIPWSESDILELLKNIEESIPKDDTISYSCRLEKLKWENISFKSYSIQECQEVWGQLHKQVRKFRLLSEVLTDVKEIVQAPKPIVRHPDKPKQPLNSYMLFVEENRQEVMNTHPTLQPMEIAKKLGQLFKELPSKERKRYEKQAKAARQEYLLKLQNFYEEHPEMIPKPNRRRKSQPEENRGPLEKPKTPFELFVQVESEKQASDAGRFIVVQKCREQWSSLTDKEKYFWVNWADELNRKYLTDLKEYMKDHPEFEPEKLKPILTKKELKIKDRYCGKPEKPPRAPYHLFSRMMLESDNVRNINHKDLMNYISEKWRACSDEEKNQYKIRVDQMWDEYYRKLDEYVETLSPEEKSRVLEAEKKKKHKTEKKVAVKEPPVKMPKPQLPPSTPYKYFLKVYDGFLGDNASNVWKAMSDQEKKGFTDRLDQERKAYIRLYEQYLKSLSREDLEKLGATLGSQSESSASDSPSDEED